MKLIMENWRKYLNEELLNELSLEDVEKRFDSKKFSKAVKRHEISPDYAREQLLARIPKDITEKDKAGALNWLISLFVKDPKQVLVNPEGRPIPRSKVTGDLELFFQIKKQNLSRFLDIRSLSKIESVSELAKVVDAAREPYKKHMEKKDYLDAEQGKLKIFENDEYIVYIPTNKGAACELGKGTEWCTAAPGLDYYEQYHKEDDPLIIFKSKTNPTWDVQMHFGTQQFMDVEDEQIDYEEAISLARLLRGNKHLPKKILNIIKDIGTTDLGGGRTVEVGLDGAKEWFLDGKRHREDGPAYEHSNGTKEWWLNGQRHREDGPAKVTARGSTSWYLNGKPHREDGPAVEHPNGAKYWWLNGKKIRSVEANGTKMWFLDDELHREDGPAVVTASGRKQWYLNGKRLTKRKWLEALESMKK
jgi:hypothetical protein